MNWYPTALSTRTFARSLAAMSSNDANRVGEYGLPRRMWQLLEPIHAVFWYAPEAFEAAGELGYDVRTRWPSYFA
jgi:hypothetical protein